MRIKARTSKGDVVLQEAESGAITRENYASRAMNFARLQGYPDGGLPIVRNGSAEFDEWVAYFGGIGMKTKALERQNVLTVPSVRPNEFDPEFSYRPRHKPPRGCVTLGQWNKLRQLVGLPPLTDDPRMAA